MTSSSADFTIDLRRLRLLRELDEWGTVTAAAQAAHLTPSAVSQQIAALSRQVGVPLLEKSGRNVRLTGPGRVLLDHAAVVEAQLERARTDLAAWADGTLGSVAVGGLSTGISGLVAPALPRLRERRPDLRVAAIELEPPACFSAVNRGEIDIALAIDYADAPKGNDRRFHRVELLTDRLDALLPADHRLAGRAGVRLADLADEEWIGTDKHAPCAQIMIGACASAGISPSIRHRVNEWASVAALVAAGCGVALVPRLAQPLPGAGTVVRPLLDVPAARLLCAVVRAGAQTNPAIAAVLTELAAVAAELDAD